ncbi:MAG TPA: tetratricopeptide repeat protein [Blastocatellia bacterium]|nr:tetratricopeptide repeat protein [Blastocatellia bacterium]
MLKKSVSALFITAVFAISAAAQEVEVDRYNITARIDTAASAVDVRAALSISNLSQSPKPKLFLRLTKLAKVSSATVNGASATVDTVDDRRVNTLSQITITPSTPIEGGAKATVELSYRIEAPESTPLLHIYPGEVLLTAQSVWVPMPSTMFTLYGATTAPFTLTLSAASPAANFRALSGGALKGEAGQNSTFEQQLNSLPMVVAGSFDQPISSERGGVRVEILVQPGINVASNDARPADPRAIPSQLGEEAGRVIDFLTRTLGPPPPGTTFRIVSSVRAGNLVEPGLLVLNEQTFRRDTLSAGVIEVLADALARIWLEGRVRLRGQEARSTQESRTPVRPRSAAFMSDSLPRYLAALYFEDRFAKDAARDLFTRMRWSYTPVAQSGRDAELGLQTPLLPNYSAAIFSKGPLVLRLLAETAGRDKLISTIKTVFAGPQTRFVTTDDLRSALTKGTSPEVERIFQQWIDSIVEPDIIVGAPLPSDKPGVQRINLRNLGTGDVNVTVVAVTASGKQVTGSVLVPSENLATAEIATAEKITTVEVDPEKLIIQSSYDNDARDAESKTTRTSPQTLLNESIGAFNKAQYPEAEAKLREAVRADPRTAILHSWLARALAAQKKFDEAAAEANAAIKVNPPVGSALAWARITLGQVALARNQAAEAARQFRAAVVEADEAAAQVAAHEAVIQAERASGGAPQIEESIRGYIAALDAAIKQPSSDKLFTLVIRNNLKRFVQGLTVSRPASWATEILRADPIDSGRVALDVGLKVRTEGKDQAGTAVFVLARIGNTWQLEDVPPALFNVK